jgi:hypothetical protein
MRPARARTPSERPAPERLPSMANALHDLSALIHKFGEDVKVIADKVERSLGKQTAGDENEKKPKKAAKKVPADTGKSA